MAKRKIAYSLKDMQNQLGYISKSIDNDSHSANQFYTDLGPMVDDVYVQTEKDFEAFCQCRKEGNDEKAVKGSLAALAGDETIHRAQDTITLAQQGEIGVHRFSVEILCRPDFDLSLRLTHSEARRTSAIMKYNPCAPPDAKSALSRLPQEIRDRIFLLALPMGNWAITDVHQFETITLPSAIGDPTGFYFPLSKSISLLRVSKQVRLEALAVAYQCTTFQLDDLDDLLKLLLAIGQIGRDNIESLEFPWESRSDLESRWDEFPDFEENHLALPKLHVSRCVQLLRRCKRLKRLRINFESELMLNMPISSFQADSGIQSLASLRGIESVEIYGLDHEPLQHCALAEWLEKVMKASDKSSG